MMHFLSLSKLAYTSVSAERGNLALAKKIIFFFKLVTKGIPDFHFVTSLSKGTSWKAVIPLILELQPM